MPHLLATPDRQRFFLVADGVALRPGPLPVMTLARQEQQCDELQLAEYEVDEATARAFVEKRLSASAELVRSLHAWAAALERVGADLQGTPAPEKVAELLRAARVSEDDMRRDPQAALARVWSFVRGEAKRS